MSMFSSASRFISTTFDTATNSLGTVEKTLDIANHFVAENHKRITKTTTTSNKLAVAEFNREVALKLEADAALQEEYDAVCADW